MSRVTRFLALLVVGVLFLGACSSDDTATKASDDPKAALLSALETLESWKGFTAELSLSSTAESLQALDDNGELPPDVAAKIVNSSVRISTLNTQDPTKAEAEFVFNLDGSDLAELRVVGGGLYVRADVRDIANLFGAPIADLEAGAQQAAAAGLGFVKDLIDGKWVGVEGLNDLLETFTGQPAEPNEQDLAVLRAFTDAFKESVEVTSEGNDDAGAHIVATIPLRKAFEDLKAAVEGLSAGLPPGAVFPSSDDVPDIDLSVDMWLKDNAVARIELDFLQFAALADDPLPEGVETFGIRLDLEEFSGGVDVPDAVIVDPTQILGGLMGGLDAGAGPGLSGGASIPSLGIQCSDLSVLDPKSVRDFLDNSGVPGALDEALQNCPELF